MNFPLNDACPVLPSLSQSWCEQHETTELIPIINIKVNITFGVAKQHMYLFAGATKVTNMRLGKTCVCACVYTFSTLYANARRHSGSWVNLLLFVSLSTKQCSPLTPIEEMHI